MMFWVAIIGSAIFWAILVWPIAKWLCAIAGKK
jgi:hypothetical protein